MNRNRVLCLMAALVLVGCGGGSETSAPAPAPASVAASGPQTMPEVAQIMVQSRQSAQMKVEQGTTIAGYRSNYTISKTDTGVYTLNNKIDKTTKTYTNVTLFKFVDAETSLDVAGPEAQVYRLYQAAFNRKPDTSGLGFWIQAYKDGKTLTDIATGFQASDEFKKMYGDAGNRAFITKVYENVLHRAPEADGLNWWVAVLDGGTTRANAMTGFSESNENKANLMPDMVNGFDYVPFYKPAGTPLIPKTTSYANAKNMNLAPITLPQEAAYADAYAQADFKQNGTMALFAAITTYNVARPQSEATPSRFSFYSKAGDGSWVKETDLIDTPNGCIHPRKAVVADFNSDGKPDVMIACHGYDVAPWAGESAWIVLSSATGKYVSKAIPNFSGFFHSATAADFNGDGKIDILATDTNSPNKARMLMGNGDGTFTEATMNMPAVLSTQYYYAVEAADVDGDGKIDLLFGADEKMNGSHSVVVVGDGTGNFTNSRVVNLPGDAANALVLDFVVKNGKIYVSRTASDGANFYNTKDIQQIDFATLNSTTAFTVIGQSWFKWLIPTTTGVASDNAQTPVVVTL
jgi:hypothetical protein